VANLSGQINIGKIDFLKKDARKGILFLYLTVIIATIFKAKFICI